MKLKLRNASKKDILVVVLGMAIIALVIWLTMMNNRMTQLENEQHKSNQTISTLSERVKKYTYNPQSLSECLSNAGNDYSNYIKTHGTAVPNEKGVGYSMSSDQWETAEVNLKKAQNDCRVMFDKAD